MGHRPAIVKGLQFNCPRDSSSHHIGSKKKYKTCTGLAKAAPSKDVKRQQVGRNQRHTMTIGQYQSIC